MTHQRSRAPAVATPRVMSLVTGLFFIAGGTAVLAVARDAARTGDTDGVGVLDPATTGLSAAGTLTAIGILGLLIGSAVAAWGARLPRIAYHLLLLTGTGLVMLASLLAPDASTATAAAGMVVFVAFDAFMYFAWPLAVAHLAVALAGAGWAMVLQPDLLPSSMVILGLLSVVVAVIVGRLSDRASSAVLDPLTGLANHRGFDEALAEAVVVARRTAGSFSVALLDVDHFEEIVADSGQTAAEGVLRTIAARWSAELPAGALLARRESHEFALLLPDLEGPVALAVVERLRAATAQIPISGGVATLHPGETGPNLMRRADRALTAAETAGRDRSVLDDATPDPLLPELRQALSSGRTDHVGLTVHYQSIVALEGGHVVGVEALARWLHPVLGPISPCRFIPLAEENGLITELGTVVLRQACQEMADLHAATGRRLLLTVNVSGHQFNDPRFPATVQDVLEATGWPAPSTVLEVTESLVEADSPLALASLAALRHLGVSVAIDDFGTGYSSLARLDTLPADYLKLDHTFTSTLTTSTRRARLMRSVMALAESLDLLLIAEGVETQEQADLLRTLGCPLAQGYLFHRPSGIDSLVELVGGVPARAAG